MRTDIQDIEPSTSSLPHNVYHLHLPLFVIDFIRMFQDHPKYAKGIKECHIVEMLEKESFICGDLEAEVKIALKKLQEIGYVRYIRQGFRTLGPFAKLALARTPRQLNLAWDKINKTQTFSVTILSSSCISN